MLGAAHRPDDVEGLAVKRLRACPVVALPEQDAEVVQRRSHRRAAIAVQLALQRERLAVERLGLSGLAETLQDPRQVGLHVSGVGAVGLPQPPEHRERVAPQPLGFPELAVVLGHLRQAVDGPRHVGVLAAVRRDGRVQRGPEALLCGREQAQPLVGRSQGRQHRGLHLGLATQLALDAAAGGVEDRGHRDVAPG